MYGKPFHRIDLFGRFMKLVYDISKKTAAIGKNTIGHVGSELAIWFGKMSGNFSGKVKFPVSFDRYLM